MPLLEPVSKFIVMRPFTAQPKPWNQQYEFPPPPVRADPELTDELPEDVEVIATTDPYEDPAQSQDRLSETTTIPKMQNWGQPLPSHEGAPDCPMPYPWRDFPAPPFRVPPRVPVWPKVGTPAVPPKADNFGIQGTRDQLRKQMAIPKNQRVEEQERKEEEEKRQRAEEYERKETAERQRQEEDQMSTMAATRSTELPAELTEQLRSIGYRMEWNIRPTAAPPVRPPPRAPEEQQWRGDFVSEDFGYQNTYSQTMLNRRLAATAYRNNQEIERTRARTQEESYSEDYGNRYREFENSPTQARDSDSNSCL